MGKTIRRSRLRRLRENVIWMLVALLFSEFTLGRTAIAGEPSDHTPIGVIGDHTQRNRLERSLRQRPP